MTTQPPCPFAAKEENGAHKLEARYDSKVADPFWSVLSNPKQKDTIYVGDVCVRCGLFFKIKR